MMTRATHISMPGAIGATAALTFGSPAVIAIAGATAVSTYAWRMAMAGPYMAMRLGKGGTAGDLARTATRQAEAVVDVALKTAHDAAEAVAEVSETAFEASVELAEEAAEATVRTVEAVEDIAVPPAPAADLAPAPAAEAAPAETFALATQPKKLKAPKGGVADDLTLIKGIGPKLAEKLGEMGIYHYSQIAAWTEAEVAWMDENLGRPTGRVSRDNWVAAAADMKG